MIESTVVSDCAHLKMGNSNRTEGTVHCRVSATKIQMETMLRTLSTKRRLLLLILILGRRFLILLLNTLVLLEQESLSEIRKEVGSREDSTSTIQTSTTEGKKVQLCQNMSGS